MKDGRRRRFAACIAALAGAGCDPLDDAAREESGAAVGPARVAGPAAPEDARERGDEAGAHGAPRAARTLLSALPVKDRAPRDGYARKQFGPAWADTDRNGCDSRNDILRRDLSGASFEPGTRDCVVVAGRLDDPYTGAVVAFAKGQASHIDIDHVVPLGNAWVTGAAAWPIEKRLALANDPLNLLAVDASANRAKGDGDAADWLPPNASFRCPYVARQVAVKSKYGLWITAAEREAMAQVLTSCPDQEAPAGDAPVLAPLRVPEPPVADRSSRPPQVKQRPASARAPDPDYGSCKNAKAHGAGPYQRDRDPEYHYYQDRDGDGVVCE